MTNRTPRDLVTREKTARSVFVPASALPDPTPEPGWDYRWIATAVLGQADPAHVSKRMREGWEPVKAEAHPELMLTGDKNGNVEIGGLMLCKRPMEISKAEAAYYAGQNDAQMESVDNHFMRNQDPRMPLFSEKRTDIQRGNGFGNGTK